MPNSFAESPDGTLLIADGFGPMLAWNGFRPAARRAGVPKPTTALTITTNAAAGRILGTYFAYVRFVDEDGKVSDLSPVSGEIDTSTQAGSVADATSTTPIQITTLTAHGLVTGQVIKIAGVGGQTGANGTFSVTVLDATSLTLDDSVSVGDYSGGGVFITGCEQVSYLNVPVSTDPRVARRQVLRNLDGEAQTVYVDVDTNNLSATSLSSSNDDDTLSTQTAVPLLDEKGVDLANVHGEPPQTKAYISYQGGRMFASGEVEYAEGAVEVTFGSASVRGIATEWTEAAAGRVLYVIGADRPYTVASVDTVNQTLTLTLNYTAATNKLATYALRPTPVERNTVYYTPAGEPESWPVDYSFTLPEDGDDITGQMAMDSWIYFLKRKRLYRFTYQDDPATDAGLYKAADRGCINNRCWVIAEGSAYMLDPEGVHVFDKGEAKSVSTSIQTMFRKDGPGPKINWASSRFFHAVLDPSRETIRWFVSLTGQYLPRHSLCYHYTLNRWDLEEWPRPVGASTLGRVARASGMQTWGDGRPTIFLGAGARKVWALDSGPLDMADEKLSPLDGTVASATLTSLTITGDVDLPTRIVNAPVVITDQRGKSQLRIITSVSGKTLRIKTPWAIVPDETSKYQIGGIPWRYQTGWFPWFLDEQSNERRLELQFEPHDAADFLTVRRYRDRSATPIDAQIDRHDDGVHLTAESPDILVEMNRPSGYAHIRIEGSRDLYTHGPRLVSFGLSGVGTTEPTRVYQLSIDGVTAPVGGQGG